MKKKAITAINILILLGILLSTYFLYLSLTPEGYTGRMLWFTYDVHSPRNPLIIIGILFLALVAINWRRIFETRHKLRLLTMLVAAVVILAGVFFFLSFKRHNRLPWERPNVLIIVVDTLRADHVSAYNKNHARTPNIDALAQDGWLFEQAYAHIPITMPSHASLFSGRLPHNVWVLNNNDKFNYPEPTLAEIFKEEGYETGAVVSLGVLRAKFNLNRGFDYYNDDFPRNGQWYNRADVVTNRGIKWLQDNIEADERFFLWLHYSDPHEPYNPPGSPPDTSIHLNGEVVKEGSLDSAAFVEARLVLKPGINTVEISRLGDNDKLRLYFTSIFFSGMDQEELPESWRELLSRHPRRDHKRKLRDLQESRFLADFNGFEFAGMAFSEGSGWLPQNNDVARPRREVSGSGCSFQIENKENESKEVTLSLKGGLYKDTQTVWESYRKEAEFADQEIGRVIDYLKRRDLMDDTIIVFLSDHGEELNEHGIVGHIHHLYTQSLRVPLIIRDPNTDHKGERIARISRIIDIAPTILDMANLHKPKYMEGRTLLEYILRNRYDVRELEAETFRSNAKQDRVGILEGEWLVVYSPDLERLRQLELYNLQEDSIQWRNATLATKPPGLLNRLASEAEALWNSLELVRSDDQQETSTQYEDEVDSEMLRDLGYLQHARTRPAADRGVPPRELIDAVRELLAAFRPGLELAVEAHRTAGNGQYYLFAEILMPADTDETTVMALQDHVRLTVLPRADDFPLHLRISAGERTIYDRVLPLD